MSCDAEMTATQLPRYFRSLTRRNAADHLLPHGQGQVEEWETYWYLISSLRDGLTPALIPHPLFLLYCITEERRFELDRKVKPGFPICRNLWKSWKARKTGRRAHKIFEAQRAHLVILLLRPSSCRGKERREDADFLPRWQKMQFSGWTSKVPLCVSFRCMDGLGTECYGLSSCVSFLPIPSPLQTLLICIYAIWYLIYEHHIPNPKAGCRSNTSHQIAATRQGFHWNSMTFSRDVLGNRTRVVHTYIYIDSIRNPQRIRIILFMK